jgi:hypothetical protein
VRTLLFALALFCVSCSEEKVVETAESRANLFVSSILNQSAQTFWDSLDEPSQIAIAKLAGGSHTDQATVQRAFTLIGRWRSVVSFKPIKADISSDATEATIPIESMNGQKMDLRLIKKGDRWFVQLPIDQITATPSNTNPTSAPASAPMSAPASSPTTTASTPQ